MKEFGRELGESAKVASMKTYGIENLPCGDISGEEIVIVEGRADVVNMLKQGVKNVICMNGVKLPETIKELTKEKHSTLFVDGDRGGKLIIKNVTENADIDFIAIAPEGKEVEELTSKEILQALRRRFTLKEYKEYEERSARWAKREGRTEEKTDNEKEEVGDKDSGAEVESNVEKITKEEKEIVKEALDEMIGTKAAILFNREMKIIRKMPLSRLFYFKPEEKVYVLAINDTASPNIIRVAESIGVSNLAAKNFTITNTSVNLVSI